MTKEEQAKIDASKANRKQALTKAFWQAVKGAIGDNKEHGWGKEDSLEVVETVIAEDASMFDGENTKYSPSDEAMATIEAVINPSQFRQILESEQCGLLTKVESKRKGTMKALLAGME